MSPLQRQIGFRSIARYLADLEACQHPPCEGSIAELTSAPPPPTLFDIPIVTGFASGSFSFFKGKLKATDYTFRSRSVLLREAAEGATEGAAALCLHRASLTGDKRAARIYFFPPSLFFAELLLQKKQSDREKERRVR